VSAFALISRAPKAAATEDPELMAAPAL
jgi:hypothetical protein